ncbi:hypothetical protein C8J57DRAFT_1522148 [Mycena rebaudengoi]|nr:hypothetical protein C8J57DRAFT_1522148 [Mycena rebaudengoi]
MQSRVDADEYIGSDSDIVMDGESGQEDGLRDITRTKVNTNQAAVKLTSKEVPAPKGKAGTRTKTTTEAP